MNGGLAGRGERGAVLVVDDDPSVRGLLVAILEDAGESVLSAADGLAALEAVRDHDVALVLLDHLLPGMTGPEVLATLRRDPETMTLPVIIVSGRDGEDDRIDGLGLGANDYIVKPFSPRELVARVRAHLRANDAWTHSWNTDWQQRADVARQLLRLSPQTPPGWAANAICTALRRLPGVDAVAVVRTDSDGSVVVSWQDGSGGAGDLMRPLDAGCDRYLRERLHSGPWSAAVNDPSVFAAMGGTRHRDVPCGFAPLEVQGRVFGVLAVAGAVNGISRSGAVTRCLTIAADLAPAASAVLAPAPAPEPGGPASYEWLDRVIEEQRFRLVFQPVIDLRSCEVVGFEALSRFDEGAAPDRVFDLARRLGLEARLELATLERAIEDARLLPLPAYVSLNMSPALVVDSPEVADLLDGSPVPVVVEITERAPVSDYVALISALDQLGPNVRVAVDDAGSGYASLSHVLALRPAIIKLDRVLIEGLDSDPGRQSLLISLCRFAEDVGSTIVAEGVETEDELRAIRSCGIEFAQGYLLGHPEPARSYA